MRGASQRAQKMVRGKHGEFKCMPEAAKAKHPKSLRNQGKPWTEEDIAMLEDLITQNTPTRVIGLKLGRSELSIRAKVRVEGFSLKPTNQSPYTRRAGSKKSGGRAANLRH